MDVLEHIRLGCHQLAEADFSRPGELVTWMGAVQAQDYASAKWAVALRLQKGTLAMVNEALRKGELVRTHVMRPTWHWVAGKDLRWMLSLSAQRIRKAVDGWVKAGGMDISEPVYTRCNDLIGKMLSGGKCFTKEEIEAELLRTGVVTADDRVKCYLLRAETEGLVCSGADRGGKPTYALLDEQVAGGKDWYKEEALAESALRYFRSHSPAGMKDFIWWSGLSATEARQAMGAIEGQLVKEHFNGEEFWVHESYREIQKKETLHFLPPYDEYLIGYKERHSVLAPEYFSKAFNRWGIFYPVILYNGRVIGNWNKIVKREQIVITVSLFKPCPQIDRDIWEAAAEVYRTFYDSGNYSNVRVEFKVK